MVVVYRGVVSRGIEFRNSTFNIGNHMAGIKGIMAQGLKGVTVNATVVSSIPTMGN